MRRHGRILAFVSVLTLTGASPAPTTYAQEPATCAPPVATSTTAMPGGNAALAAPQPGPGPGAAPVTCWTGVVGQPLLSPGLLAFDDAVYASDDAGNVIAFDAATGAERWRYALTTSDGSGQVRGIAPGAGVVYAAGPEGLAAIEVADGSRAWRYRVKSDGLLVDADGFFWPIEVSSSVFGVTSSTGADGAITRAVVALDAATGDELWSTPLPDGASFGQPTSDGTMVVLAPGDGTLVALDAATGASVWSTATVTPTTPVAIGSKEAYVGLSGGVVSARSTLDGTEVWRATMDSGTVTAVTAVGDTVYVNGVLTVYALDAATGTERWRSTVQSGTGPFAFSVVPAVTADTVYVGSSDLDVVRIDALDGATGTPRWHLDTEMYGALLTAVVGGGRLVVVAYDATGSGGLVSLGDRGS
jgi:outer membrane protein assembly factor BamB